MHQITFFVSIILATFKSARSQDLCYFDFELDSELDNFKNGCNGIGKWNIVDRPGDNDADGTHGEKVATTVNGANGCIETNNKLQLVNPTVTVEYVWKGDPTGSTELSITLVCDNEPLDAWKIIDSIKSPPNVQKWYKESHDFTLSDNCKVKTELYRNGQEIGIDRITVDGADTSSCYVVPKPTITTTEEPTSSTTTEEPTSSTTSEEPSSTDQPASTTSEATTTGSSPTSASSSTNEPPTTSSSTEPETSTAPSESPGTLSDPPGWNPTTTETPSQTSPGIVNLYMVAIIATAGGIAAICFLTCAIIIWLQPQIRRIRQKPIEDFTFMPSKKHLG